jgi:septum site-determining protein MinD
LPAAQKRDKGAVKPAQMVELCAELKKRFDLILIDSPAGIEDGFRNAVAPADEVLIVTTPEMSALRDADRIVGLLAAAEKPEPRLIINRLRPDMVRRGEMLGVSDVRHILEIELIGIVPEDKSIITGTNSGQPVAFDEKSAAGKNYRTIARRLLGEKVPLDLLDQAPGFLRRFFPLFQ